MPFDMGFDFRSSAAFVTDPAYAVAAVQFQGYPYTFTNANGDSINAGWQSGDPSSFEDHDNTNDPRIAGDNYMAPNTAGEFTVDLSSGSAPGAGTYTIDLAIGSAGWSKTHTFDIRDDSTVLIDGTAGYTTAIDHYIDATLNDVAATTTWTGTTVNKTFATTTCRIMLDPNANGDFAFIAHFRLTKQATAYTLALDAAMLTLTGQAVSPRATRQLALGTAHLTTTGQATGLQAARQLALDTASLTLTGQAAGLVRGYTMAMDPALLTVAGQDTTLRRTAQLLLDRGLLRVSGQAITLRKGGGAAGAYRQRRDTMQPFRRRWSA